jgi:hypothetical protein
MSVARTTLSLCLLGLAGCGSAVSNADWVRAPEPGTLSADESLTLDHEQTTLTLSEAVPSSGPQRLARTITLGSVEAMPPSAPAPSPAGTATVVVNVNNYSQPAYAPYGGYYGALPVALSDRGGRPSSPARSGPAPVIPGQSWPAAPSYGPSFPYSTSPASPWETKR